MSPHWQTILILATIFDVILSNERQNCLDIYNTCRKNFVCNLDLNITEEKCKFKWKEDPPQFCPRDNNFHLCKSAIKTNTMRFKSCVCGMGRNHQYCSAIWRALTKHPCIVEPVRFEPENSGKKHLDQKSNVKEKPGMDASPPLVSDESLEPIRNPLIDRNLRLILADLGIQSQEDNKPSCLERERLCNQSKQCRFLLDRFLNLCTFKKCEMNRSACFTIYENFRSYGTFNCSCSREKRPEQLKQCLSYQTRVIDNQCLALINSNTLYKSSPGSRLNDNSDSPLINEDDIPKFNEVINCVDQYRECIKDSRCLAKYLQLERACRWNPKTNTCPNYEYCMAALQSMYQEPTSLAYNALTCECPTLGDQECQRHKMIFRPSCAYRNRTAINCLSLMNQCINNMTCLDSFTVFNEYCIRQGRSESSPNPVCPYSSTTCLDSYRTLWGRSLTLACTCDYGETLKLMAHNPQKAEQSVKVCHHFREVLARPPCLKSRTNEAGSFSVDYTTQPCAIIKRHHLPTDLPVRVYPPELPAACYKLCYCNRTNQSDGRDFCQKPICDQSQQQGDPARDVSDSCYFYASRNPECVCQNSEISCKPFSIRTDIQSTGFSLDVLYNSSEKRRLFDSQNLFYLSQLKQSLNHILHNNTRTTDCSLLLLSHKQGHAKFLLSIKTPPFSPDTYLFKQKKRQCFHALNLVTIMINENYPEIRHIVSLSILLEARLLKAKSFSDDDSMLTTEWMLVDFSEEWPPPAPRPRMDMYNNRLEPGGSGGAASLTVSHSLLIVLHISLLIILRGKVCFS